MGFVCLFISILQFIIDILEHYSFDEGELDSLFDEAVSKLPESDLKAGLKKHFQAHLKKLKR